MGILAHIKIFAPLSLYIAGAIAFILGLTGKVHWPLLIAAFLIPLRNVIEKLAEFPIGGQFLDIMFFSMILGWFFSSNEKKPLMDKSPVNGLAIALILYMTLSLMIGNFSIYGSPLMDASDPRVQDWKNFCLLPVLFFITYNNIRDRVWIQRLFWVMCFSILVSIYYTTSQIAMYSSLESRSKISGTFQFLGPNEVAAFLNQCTIVIMGVFFFLKKSKARLALLALIWLNIYCIIFLYSRAAYMGLSLGMFILFAVKKRALLIPLVLVLLLWQTVLPEKVIERIKGTTNAYGELDESSEGRLEMWDIGLHLFAGSPIVGIGFGVFRSLGLMLGDTHNIYVKLLVEQGLVGLIIFLSLVFTFMREGFKLYQKGEDDFAKGMGLGFLACMFTLMVNNFFGDRWAYFELSGYIWIFAGMVASLNRLSAEGPGGQLPAAAAATQASSAANAFKSSAAQDITKPKKRRASYYKRF